MKTQNVFIGLLLATALLLSTIAVIGDGNDPMDHQNNHGSETPDNSRDISHRPMVGRDGYRGMADRMIIEGNVSVTNAINISLTVKPTEEMDNMMNEEGMMNEGMMNSEEDMMDEEEMGDMYHDMRHTMSVLITELVEYRDEQGDGYTEDDAILSTFKLNSTTLSGVEFTNESGIITYRISSIDNSTFSLILEVNATTNLPNEWKWSYDIKYPFTNNSSKLAVLHEIRTSQGSLVAGQHRMDQMARFTHMNNSKIVADHAMLPMLFTWDKIANIDGTESNVEATGNNGTIALSFEQGSSIFYDPRLSIDEEVIQEFDQNLANMVSQNGLSNFAEMLGLPNANALILTGVFTTAILAIAIWKKK